MAFYRVNYEAGAFIDNYFYRKDEVVELDLLPGQTAPLWGTLVDKNGNEINPDGNTSESVDDKLAAALANRMATGAGQAPIGKPAATNAVAPDPVVEARKGEIEQALNLLDAKDDAHWTKEGLPKLEVLEGLLTYTVSRAEVSAAKEGFHRPAATK